jgi:hypothetical protein
MDCSGNTFFNKTSVEYKLATNFEKRKAISGSSSAVKHANHKHKL